MMNNTMANEPSGIERVVMRRVRTISVLRPFVSGGMLAAVVLAAALWAIGREVWVAKVLSNGPQNLTGHAEYLVYAFQHTRLVVQALVLTMLGAAIYLARAAARALTELFVPPLRRA